MLGVIRSYKKTFQVNKSFIFTLQRGSRNHVFFRLDPADSPPLGSSQVGANRRGCGFAVSSAIITKTKNKKKRHAQRTHNSRTARAKLARSRFTRIFPRALPAISSRCSSDDGAHPRKIVQSMKRKSRGLSCSPLVRPTATHRAVERRVTLAILRSGASLEYTQHDKRNGEIKYSVFFFLSFFRESFRFHLWRSGDNNCAHVSLLQLMQIYF